MPKKTAGVSPSDEFGMNKMISTSEETPERKLGEVHFAMRQKSRIILVGIYKAKEKNGEKSNFRDAWMQI